MRIADVGAVSQRVVKNIDTWTLFANRRGIYYYDGANTRLVSQKINKFIKAANQDNVDKWVAWTGTDTYNLYIGDIVVDGKSYPNCTITYYVSQNSFRIRTFSNIVRCAANFIVSGAEKTMFGSSSGDVYILDSTYKHGTSDIDFEVVTPLHHFGNIEDNKDVTTVTVFCDQAEGTKVSIYTDVSSDPVSIGECQNGTTVIPIANVHGRRFGLIFSHSQGSNQPLIEGYSFEWSNTGDF
jgi:hypothetical protein